MRVMIVDDERKEVDQLKTMIQAYAAKREVEIEIDETLNHGDVNCDALVDYDILFLDINMPGVNGLQVAKRVREKGSQAAIIFCTNYAQYALNGYEVSALGYLIKPVTDYSLFKNLDRACAAVEKKYATADEHNKIVIKTMEGQQIVPIDELVYVEVIKHNLYFYVLKDGKLKELRARMSMQEIGQQLEVFDFVRCGISYLVNMRYITSVQKAKGRVEILGDSENEVTLPITRSYLKPFMEKFMQYIER